MAWGINYLNTHSFLAPGVGITEEDAEADVETINTGGIARINYCWDQTIGFEAVYGLTHFNATNKEISYNDGGQIDPVYKHRNQGFALAANIKAEKLLSSYIPAQLNFFDNLITFRYLNASLEPMYTRDEVITGSGTEIGLLDTFYIRNGNYDDDAGEINGRTKGYGINIHYKNLVGLCYNYAEMPGGSLLGTQKSEDYSVNIDFVNLLQLVRN
jgi:hypothetical protein